MKNKYFMGLFFIIVLFLSACTKINIGIDSYPTTNQTNSKQDVSYGIQKDQIPPDFTLRTIEGQQYTLSNFKNENRPVLLYFFATWCPYCSEDFNTVKNIYQKYSDKVTFLAIDLDSSESAEHIKRYKDGKGLADVNFATADKKILVDYAITHTTTKYAIGKKGTILYKGSGVFDESQWEILLSGLANS